MTSTKPQRFNTTTETHWYGQLTLLLSASPYTRFGRLCWVLTSVGSLTKDPACITGLLLTDQLSYCEELSSFRGLEVQLATLWQKLQVLHASDWPAEMNLSCQNFLPERFRDGDDSTKLSVPQVPTGWLISGKGTWHACMQVSQWNWQMKVKGIQENLDGPQPE